MCDTTSKLWQNWVWNKSSIDLCAYRVPHRYLPTITAGVSDPYDVYASNRTFLKYRQITRTMVITTIQHSDFHDPIAFPPYVVVTKCIWNLSISAANWNQNTPYLPSILFAGNFDPMYLPNSLFIPGCNFIIRSCKYFDAQGCIPLAPSLVFHNSGVQISARGVVDYFP